MKPFNKMKIEEKVRLLYRLFPEQAKESIAYIGEAAKQFQQDPKDEALFFSDPFWQRVAGDIAYRCTHDRKLYRCSRAFALQLFPAFYAVFTVALYREYFKQPDIAGTAFAQMAAILLTVRPLP